MVINLPQWRIIMKKKVSPKIILKNGGLFMGLIILTLYIILKNNNMEDIIKSADRKEAGPTAPAKGLKLVEIRYV